MLKFENGNYFSYDMIGEFRSAGEWLHPKRKIENYEAILVLEGNVYIAEEKKEYSLQKNELIILEPHKEHYGYRTVTEPTAFYWFHFFTNLEIPLKSYSGEDVYEIKRLFKRLLHISNTACYSHNAADAAGYLIFEELKRLSAGEGFTVAGPGVKITEYIRNNIKNGVTIAEIARNLGYNADYLGKYFKKAYGVGLKKYLADARIKLAKDLLLTTDMSVKQLAAELGYENENLFVKFFTYHENISPAAFAGKYRNTHINNR